MTLFLLIFFYWFFCDRFCARSIPWPHCRECGFEGVIEGQWRRWNQTPLQRGRKHSEIWKDREKSYSLERKFFVFERQKKWKREQQERTERGFPCWWNRICEEYALSLSLNFFFHILELFMAWLTLVFFSFLTWIFKTSFCWLISVRLLSTIYSPWWMCFFFSNGFTTAVHAKVM